MDTHKYIGIPYVDNGISMHGCDCWGLIMLIYQNEYNITLPDYSTQYPDTQALSIISPIVEVEKESDIWYNVETPEEGDIIVFNIKGAPVHCGVYLSNKDFIHNFHGCNSCIESVKSTRWNKRVEGYYRHVSRKTSTGIYK